MAAQGLQTTLEGASQGDVVKTEDLTEGRDSFGHGRAVGLFLLSRLGKCLGGLVKGRLEPGGSLDRRVNCRCVSQPRWVGARRNTWGNNKGEPRLVLSCAQGGCACSRGLQAFTRERVRAYPSARSPARPPPSYEGPGPSFYRCKEKAEVYNGGCSKVLTCLAERCQSPMYMPTWLSERCWSPVHVVSWPSEERLSPVEA
jgi:hypothetical protein